MTFPHADGGPAAVRRFPPMLNRLSHSVNTVVEGSLGLMGMIMALVVAAQVFSRYVLNDSLFWSEELARYLLVWLTFLGASSAYRRRVHPAIDMALHRTPAWLRQGAAVTVHLVSLAFFLVMVIWGLRFTWFVRLQITPALGLPKWTVLAVIPLAGMFMALHALAFLVGEFQKETLQEKHR